MCQWDKQKSAVESGLRVASLIDEGRRSLNQTSSCVVGNDAGMTSASMYVDFAGAVREARDASPTYERAWAPLAVSRDDDSGAAAGAPPPGKRQPNLLFGVAAVPRRPR